LYYFQKNRTLFDAVIKGLYKFLKQLKREKEYKKKNQKKMVSLRIVALPLFNQNHFQ